MTFVSRLIQFCIHNRKLTIFINLLICALLIPGITKISVSTSYKDYLSRDNPNLRFVEEIETTYSSNNNIFVMFHPKQGDIFTRDTLAAIREFTDKAWTLPYVKRVDSLSNYQHTWADGDDLVVAGLVESTRDLTTSEISRIKSVALNEPELVNYLVSSNGQAAGINIDTLVDDSKTDQVQEAVAAVDNLLAEIRTQHPNIETHKVGLIAISDAWLDAAESDITRVLPIAIVTVFIGLAWFFGAPGVSVATLAITILAILNALGIVGYLGGSLVPMTVSGVIMILILAVADAVHIISSAGALISQGLDKKLALEKSILVNFKAIALTSITTAVGFVFFNLSEFAGLRTLGNLVAIGVMVAFVLSITIFPALASFCDLKPSRERIKLQRYIQLGHWVLKHYRPILAVFLTITLLSLYLVQKIELDDGMAKYLSDRTLFKKDLNAFESELTGSIMLMYNIKSKAENTVNKPEFMHQVDALTQWFRSQPEVRFVSSYTDIMRRLNSNLNNGSEVFYKIPDNPQLASQYLLLYELSLPYGLDLTNRINMDKSGTLVTVIINDINMEKYFDLNDRAVAWMKVNMPEFVTETSGVSYTMAVTTEQNFLAMLESAGSALVMVVVMLMIALKSLRGGLICGLGILIPLLVSFAIWYLYQRNIGVAESMVIGMVIGITVDNTVHFMTKYFRALREQQYSVYNALIYAFQTVGEPLFINTAALGVGFSLLALSNFTVYFTLGVLTALTILLALVATFTLIPSLVMLEHRSFRKSLPEQGQAESFSAGSE